VLCVILKGDVTVPLGTVMDGFSRASPTGGSRTPFHGEVLYLSLQGVPIPPHGGMRRSNSHVLMGVVGYSGESAHGFHHACNALVRPCLDVHNIDSSKLA